MCPVAAPWAPCHYRYASEPKISIPLRNRYPRLDAIIEAIFSLPKNPISWLKLFDLFPPHFIPQRRSVPPDRQMLPRCCHTLLMSIASRDFSILSR